MADINEILARAAALRNETALNSISPERAGGIMYDTLLALNELWLQQGAALVISKIYASVSAMEADTAPVSDLTGKPLRPGQIVVIASSDSDNGSVYRYNGTESPSWSLVGSIGNLEPVDSLDSDSTTLPLAAHQGKVLDGKISQLGQYLSDPEWIKVVTDRDGRVLCGIKADGSIEWFIGVPSPVQEYVSSLLANKVDKVSGKELSSNDFTNTLKEVVETSELLDSGGYIKAIIDDDDKILEGITSDGVKILNIPFSLSGNVLYPTIDNQYIQAIIDKDGRLLEGININGEKHISSFDANTKDSIRKIATASVIDIPQLDGNFVSPVPVEIIGTKGHDDAKYVFKLPFDLKNDTYNIRFKFKITENLLNQNKTSVIAKLGGTDAIIATPVQLYQDANVIDAGGEDITEYSFHLYGGLRLNGYNVSLLTNNQNIGDFAFYVKYIGNEEDATLENTGAALVLTIGGISTNYSYSVYPSVAELYNALKQRNDLEVDFCAIETRLCTELAKFGPCHLITKQYRDISGTKQDNPVLYVDAAPFFVPYAIDNVWHQVEIINVGGVVYSACDGHIISITPFGDTLTLGGDCGVLFKELVIHTNSLYDAEYIDVSGTSWTTDRIISSANPHILIYEGHNILEGATYENVAEDELGVTVDRLNVVFNALNSRGYVPVTLQEIANYYDRQTELPKRCFAVVYDDYEFANCIHRAYRAPHTRYNVKPTLSVISGMSENTDIKLDDNTTISIQEAVSICHKYNFYTASHTRNHRYITHTKQSDYMSDLIADTLDEDKKSIKADILVYPFGSADNYLSDTLKWLGFRLGVNILSNNPNRLFRNKFNIGRQELGLREDIDNIINQMI